MTVHSGKHGVVNAQSTVRNWTVNETQAPARGVASNTLLGPVRKRGVHDWTGSYGAYGGIPVVMPGEIFTFTGYTSPDDDVSGVGQTLTGQAIVESVAITWNWAAGEMLSYVTNFGAAGALTASTGTITDVTTPDMPEIGLTKWQYEPTAPGFLDIPNLTQAVLNISCALQTYVNSSTVIAGKVWTFRKSGVIDWNVALTQQDNERSTLFTIGDDVKLKGFINATEFWDLQWGHVRDFSGLNVDRESGAIIQRTINMDMNGILAGVAGRIRKPAAVSDWWPAP